MMDIIKTAGHNGAFLAPLAGISDLPFRLIARSLGCSLAYTEMISANGLIRKTAKTYEYLKTCADDRPLGAQIFGADPEIMAEAARIVADHGVDLIDINMGCPVRKVIKAGAGAILMKDPDRIARIVDAVKRAVKIPVTVKIRSGWTRGSINAVEIARIVEDCGADAITVHARTADQGYSGHADWRIIAGVKKALKIQVIGNGDIRQPQDAVRMLQETSCDAVMVGRGSLGNPWIFKGISQALGGQTVNYLPELNQRLKMIENHWKMEVEFLGGKLAGKNFRKQILWYTKGLDNSHRFRELAGKLKDEDGILNELHEYFRLLNEDTK
ncbi:MAG: tRNA dihydrouridine synthase DusB [Deltaproteobacteria bacterium HGW-Deltaproteobacteria-13]|jgi:nifR3 family TIM-barrel protein|nr:MAG: tRNA dihydrouridine synthase DusB [Deltaproteobacteria bacterium HGW-Deltaproteobacteria-13]